MNTFFSRLLPVFLTLLILATPSSSSLQAQEVAPLELPPLILGQGEQRLVRVPGLLRYSLGSPAVHARVLGKEGAETLLVKGVSTGNGDLWIWKRSGQQEHRTLRVERISPDELKPQLERALGALQETEVIYAGGSVVLRGEITHLDESARIAALVHGHPEEITDETTAAETLLAKGQAAIEKWLRTSGHETDLRVERVAQTLWVRGNIEHPSEKTILEKQLRALFPFAQLELESLPDHAPTVYFRVFLLELKKSRFSTLGISWPGSQEGAFRISTSGIQNLLSLNLTLQELEGDGSARLLSNPELVVRAPGEAELFAGGELPIQQKSHFFSSVSWKSYGLTLKLKVTHSTGDRVRLDIFTEVSHLDSTTAVDQIPSIQANRMTTQVDARYGVPLLLSGLLQQGVREQAKGLPMLRNIPVLGLLFGSQDYLDERSELVAILYPHTAPPPAPMEKIMSSMPKGPVPLPRNWISRDEEKRLRASSDFPWNALK